MNSGEPLHSSKASLISYIAILLGVMYFAFRMIEPYLLALIMGGILALLTSPLYKRLMHRGVGRRKAAALITFAAIFLVITPLLTFATLAIKQGIAIAESMSGSESLSLEKITSYVTRWVPVGHLLESIDLDQYAQSSLRSIGTNASQFILNMAKGIPEGSLQIVLICLACYFMLVDGPTFLRWAYARVPLSSDVRLKVAESFKETAISVIWASMAASFAQALCMLLAYSALGVPAAFLAGGLTFIFAFVPFAGSAPVWLAGALYLFVQGSYIKLVIMLVLGVFTSTIDNFVRPWILRGRSEMHPLVALVAIFGGIQMFGLYGVFLGPILAAVVVTLLQLWPMIGRRYGLEFDN